MYKNGERMMAWIAKIDSVKKHPNADSLDICTVGGWECITKLGEYKPDDLVIYISIDAWVPHELAPFLSKGNEPRVYNGVKGERLKTIKLRNTPSQGLILPIDTIPENAKSQIYNNSIPTEGLDVTEIFNIQKWEREVPAQLVGQCCGNFPNYISKTTQERCQNLKKEIFEDNKETRYEVTLKMDGSSMTVYCKTDWILDDDGPYLVDVTKGVCSRNLGLKLDQEGNSFVDMAINSGLLEVLTQYCASNCKSLAIQGELCGAGIQGNKDGFSKTRYNVFDIFDIDTQEYLSPTDRMTVFAELVSMLPNEAQVYHVPVLHNNVTLDDLSVTGVKDLLLLAEGKSYFGKTQAEREGLVFKSMNGQFSFKAISNRFLLKGGDE